MVPGLRRLPPMRFRRDVKRRLFPGRRRSVTGNRKPPMWVHRDRLRSIRLWWKKMRESTKWSRASAGDV